MPEANRSLKRWSPSGPVPLPGSKGGRRAAGAVRFVTNRLPPQAGERTVPPLGSAHRTSVRGRPRVAAPPG